MVLYISVFLSALYIGIVLFLRSGLQNLAGETKISNLSFSVIIAARNEEKNIARCLRSVCDQTISSDRFEVIIVNDRSSDNTGKIVEEILLQYDNIKTLNISEITEMISPKKNALSAGIHKAKCEILVFTDADCVVKPTWLETIDKYFNTKIGVIQGISTYPIEFTKSGLFSGIQALDFISHGIISAAGIGAGVPMNSNANNMAVRRDAFEDVGGYGLHERVLLGDDDLLVQEIWRRKKWTVRHMPDFKGCVETIPPENISEMITQRQRWGSVAVHYRFLQKIILGTIFFFYCTLFVLFFAGFFNTIYFTFFGLMFFSKISGELIILIPGTNLFKQKSLRSYFIPATIFHLPLVIYSVFTGCFGKVKWKQSDLNPEKKR